MSEFGMSGQYAMVSQHVKPWRGDALRILHLLRNLVARCFGRSDERAAAQSARTIEHLEIDDLRPDPEPSVVLTAAVLRSTRLLRTHLRRYRRLVERLLRSGPPPDDLPF